jgi:hypothetical protein
MATSLGVSERPKVKRRERGIFFMREERDAKERVILKERDCVRAERI